MMDNISFVKYFYDLIDIIDKIILLPNNFSKAQNILEFEDITARIIKRSWYYPLEVTFDINYGEEQPLEVRLTYNGVTSGIGKCGMFKSNNNINIYYNKFNKDTIHISTDTNEIYFNIPYTEEYYFQQSLLNNLPSSEIIDEYLLHSEKIMQINENLHSFIVSFNRYNIIEEAELKELCTACYEWLHTEYNNGNIKW